MRVTREEMFEEIALAVAKRGTCERKKVGALITRDGRVISMGYCGAPSGMDHCTDVGCLVVLNHCIRTVHAEANAIAYAARHGINVEGAEMYITLEPCLDCAKLIINSGIKAVHILCHRGDYSDIGTKLLEAAGVAVSYSEVKV